MSSRPCSQSSRRPQTSVWFTVRLMWGVSTKLGVSLCQASQPKQRPQLSTIARDSLLVPVPRQSMPNVGSVSLTCWAFTLATVSMGLSPEFSARAIGMASRESANARMAYCSIVDIYSVCVCVRVCVCVCVVWCGGSQNLQRAPFFILYMQQMCGCHFEM